MFGSKARQELEEQLRRVQSQLEETTKAKEQLERELGDARASIESLKAELRDTDYDALKEKSKATIAEYEGLKDLYNQKIQAFDASKEEEEQKFARDAALQRFNLENEIRDNRQANEDFVASTVKSFGESYNYYLNQIKVLMDALSDVATRTGSALFQQPGADLKANFGQLLAEELRSGAGELQGAEGDLIVIGSPEESEKEAEAPAEEAADKAEEAAENVEEAAEAVAEAAGEAMETGEEALEAFEEIADFKGEESF